MHAQVLMGGSLCAPAARAPGQHARCKSDAVVSFCAEMASLGPETCLHPEKSTAACTRRCLWGVSLYAPAVRALGQHARCRPDVMVRVRTGMCSVGSETCLRSGKFHHGMRAQVLMKGRRVQLAARALGQHASCRSDIMVNFLAGMASLCHATRLQAENLTMTRMRRCLSRGAQRSLQPWALGQHAGARSDVLVSFHLLKWTFCVVKHASVSKSHLDMDAQVP